MNLQNKTDDELYELLAHYENISKLEDTEQMTAKLNINSIYGALGSEYFILYNPDLAEAITSYGRYQIRDIGYYVRDEIKEKFNTDISVSLNDTDSVVGDSMIYSKKYGKIAIQEYFEIIQGVLQVRQKDDFVIHISEDDKILSMNKNEKVEYKKVTYIKKHKVKKRMYKIKVIDKSVTVTEDHSIIVKRNNKIISIKPFEIQKTDMICYI